jgi:acyl-coenzyme A thioesterase PaaI-like protein
MPQQHRKSQPTELTPSTRELLRSGLQHAVPFNLHNEIRIREVAAGYGEAELPEAEHLKNHIGTQHGGALFAVAEAAAGAAYIGAFASHLEHIRMNAQEAHITYKHWATGPITARSTLAIDPTELLDTLHNDGHVDLSMSCKLYDAQQTLVAEITFRFYLKQVRTGGIPQSARQATTQQPGTARQQPGV